MITCILKCTLCKGHFKKNLMQLEEDDVYIV